MPDEVDPETLFDVANQVMGAAGCASLVTLDESGLPSSRAVRAFPSDARFGKVTIATHPDSRKTAHVRARPDVLLTWVDEPSRSYFTIAGRAELNDRLEDRRALWAEPFSVFWPDGPESDDFLLIEVVPQRIELRSFTLGVAEDPTRWSPAQIRRTDTGDWRTAG